MTTFLLTPPMSGAKTGAIDEDPTIWTFSTYALALALVAGVAACMWGVPLALSDNLVLLLQAQSTTLWDGVRRAFLDTGTLRPFYWAQYKILLDLSQGHYYLAFQGAHVVLFAATVFLSVAVLRVRTAIHFAAAAFALVVLLGIHTFGNLVREQPILVVTCCALAMVLSFADESAGWRDALAAVNLAVAMFVVETGLLVWVVYTSAYLCGQRGLSRRGLTIATGIMVMYFVLRFFVLPAGVPSLFPRETGFGFSHLSSDDLLRRFGDRPLVFYAYNIIGSMASVWFSEPRQGLFHFVRRLVDGGLRPWMWLNVLSSAATSLALIWFLVRSRAAWRRGITREEAIVAVSLAVLLANAVISYPYSRDVTMAPAGLFYAIATAPVVAAVLETLGRAPAWRRRTFAIVLLVLSTAWSARTVALTYSLRHTAFLVRNDWAAADGWLRGVGRQPSDERGQALVNSLRDQALHTPVPNPGIAQRFAEVYLGTGDY